jgi:large repetitive protein
MSKFSLHVRWLAAVGLGVVSIVTLAIPAFAAPGDVSTLAGSGVAGFVNATGTAASFNAPDHIVVDKAGNVFVSDSTNYVVRKITPAGVVTTFVGSGVIGSTVDGTGTLAGVSGPGPMAIDANDNIYLFSIRKLRLITPAGVVTTLTNSNGTGTLNGPAATATFVAPSGIAVNSVGDVFIADGGSHLIRKLSGGIVTTFAGSGLAATTDGNGTSASFNSPTGLVFDSSGNLFVNEALGKNIRKLTQQVT